MPCKAAQYHSHGGALALRWLCFSPYLMPIYSALYPHLASFPDFLLLRHLTGQAFHFHLFPIFGYAYILPLQQNLPWLFLLCHGRLFYDGLFFTASVLLDSLQQADAVRRHGLPLRAHANALLRRSLDTDLLRGNAQHFGKIFSHLRDKRGEFRHLG